MELEIQKFLRAGNSFEKLEADFGITVKQHSKYSNLYQFKYNQILSPFTEKIVRECRGIILDKDKDWAVVAMAFTKFFNSLENLAVPINWCTARVQEKLDGSLIILWRYNNKWNVATSGCPDGTNKVGDFDKTFEDLFWECFVNQNLLTCNLNPTYTYMWELTSPLNRVVCDYKDSRITLTGVRDNTTLAELPVNDFKDLLPVVKEYPLNTLEACLEAASKLDPLQNEGFVAVDAEFYRVKIKGAHYVALHHLRDGCSVSKLCEAIRAGEYAEFSTALDTYPDIKAKFLELVKKYEDVVKWCNLTYVCIGHIKNQKEFAMEALKSQYSTILFGMRKSGKSPQAIIKDMTSNAYLKLLGVK